MQKGSWGGIPRWVEKKNEEDSTRSQNFAYKSQAKPVTTQEKLVEVQGIQ